jgi:hypothetical protein
MAEHTVHDEMLAVQLCAAIGGKPWTLLTPEVCQHWRLQADLMVSEGQEQRRAGFYGVKKEQENG